MARRITDDEALELEPFPSKQGKGAASAANKSAVKRKLKGSRIAHNKRRRGKHKHGRGKIGG